MKQNYLRGFRFRPLLAMLLFCLLLVLPAPIPVFADSRFDVWTADNGLPQNSVYSIIQSHDGYIWFTTFGGLVRYDGVRFTVFDKANAPGIPSSRFTAIYEDGDGAIWVGSYDGGLNRFKDGHFTSYNMSNGLFDNSVFQILEDAQGNFWMSCNRGIYRVSQAELNEFAEGRRSSVTSIYYGKRDGLLNTECNGGAQPAGFRSRDGRLWFPTQDGMAVVDPSSVQRSTTPPPVAIEEFTIGSNDVFFRERPRYRRARNSSAFTTRA